MLKILLCIYDCNIKEMTKDKSRFSILIEGLLLMGVVGLNNLLLRNLYIVLFFVLSSFLRDGVHFCLFILIFVLNFLIIL